MRRKLFLGGVLTLAVFGITAGSAMAITPVQTIDGELGGKATPKFDKKKFKKTSVEVTTTTSDARQPEPGCRRRRPRPTSSSTRRT